jgi:hypothetical protein
MKQPKTGELNASDTKLRTSMSLSKSEEAWNYRLKVRESSVQRFSNLKV